MNILLIHPHDIYSSIEPWTIRVVSFAREFSRKGHKVILVHFPRRDNFKKHAVPVGNIRVIALSRKIGPFILIVNFIKIFRLAGLADVVHFQKCFHWASVPALLAGCLRNKHLHYDWDDWEEKIYCLSHKKPQLAVIFLLRFLESFIPRLVDTISVSSEYLKGLCLNLGIRSENIFKVPVGADLDEFNPAVCGKQVKDKYGLGFPVVTYIGQLHGVQYAGLFLEAAGIVSQHEDKACFMVIGEGYLRPVLEEFCRKAGLKNVVFTGHVPHSEINRYIACSDICVASFEDNLATRCKSPLKIVEYLSSGKPVVACDTGEVSQMVGDAGLLVKPGSASRLAEGIIKLISDSALRMSLGEKSRKRAEDIYNWKVSSETLLKAYGHRTKEK